MKNKNKLLGVIAAPAWHDPTIDEFRLKHGNEFRYSQTILGPPAFDYSFASAGKAEGDICTAARLLSEAGSSLVIQVGPYFAYQIGKDKEGVFALQARISEAAGVSVILNGAAVISELDRLGAKRLNLVCPYYNDHWFHEFKKSLTGFGYQIVGQSNFVDEGIIGTQEEVDRRAYDFSIDEVIKVLRRGAEKFDDYDAIVISGAGVRTLGWLEELEAEIGKPIISADGALYRQAICILRDGY